MVVGALVLLAFLMIVDRIAISAAKSQMQTELRISDISFGAVFGAFALGYAALMVPSGWAVDRLGPRRFLALIVVLWSLFTAGTGMVHALNVLIAIRFCFGLAEAGAFPAATRAVYNWVPVQGRGTALGLLNTGSRLGAGIGLTIIPVTAARLGWRPTFSLLGSIGILWAAAWSILFRDSPRHGAVPEPSAQSFRRAQGWTALFRPLSTYLLLLQYFASNFTFFICFSWLLPYLSEQYQLSPQAAGSLASIPLYCGAAAAWSSGWCVDRIYRRRGPAWSRRLPAICGFGIAAGSLLLAAAAPSPLAFILCFSLATAGVDFTLSPSWTVCSDVGGELTGTLSGAMNMLGSLGSFTSSLAFPLVLRWTGSVRTYFYAAALLDVLAILCWLRLAPPTLKKQGEQ
jgi:ACS family glucarate transporter-like MFS transporter